MSERDYYCNQKFWWLSVNTARNEAFSCCTAEPIRISNYDDIFNCEEFVSHREDMLNNIRTPNCDICWKAEDSNRVSRRVNDNGSERTHTNKISYPEVLNISFGIDCNLSCVYCCPQYSSSWIRDVHNNPYTIQDSRFNLSNKDKILVLAGQKLLAKSNSTSSIVNACKKYKTARVIISGGEPFLDNQLIDLVTSFDDVTVITGLGVNTNRLTKMLDKMPLHVKFRVSAETTGKTYEFVRYGNSWDNFRRNLDLIVPRFNHTFASVISNLTIHDYTNFKKQYGTSDDVLLACEDPTYLSPVILDDLSRSLIDPTMNKFTNGNYSREDERNFKLFIREYASRRNLSFGHFPESFQQWILDSDQSTM